MNAVVYMYGTASNRSMSYVTYLFKNGAAYLRQQASIPYGVSDDDYSGVLSDVIYFNGTTDYAEVYVTITDITSGGGGAIPNGSVYVRFSGAMVRSQ
jgi:hypothetical protein